MIFSHLPGPPQIIDFPLGGKGYKYLVADPERKRVVVMENGTENRRQGFRELAEMNETDGAMSRFALQKCSSYQKCHWQT